MKYITTIALILILSFLGKNHVHAQAVSWYYPWDNAIQKLEAAKTSEIVAIPLNGKAYRILKVSNNTSKQLVLGNYSIEGNSASVKLDVLPVIQNFNNSAILDLIQPFSNRPISLNKGEAVYFLVQFTGIRKGENLISIVLKQLNGQAVTLKKKVYVGHALNAAKLNLNVWAYFNNPLIKGLRNQVVSDLVSHKANVLIIPPNVLPAITTAKVADNAPELEQFIKGLSGKFDYYIVYRNYKNYKDDFAMSDKWKRNFPVWVQLVKNTLIKSGINYSTVYFYPYDEPSTKQAESLIKMINWSKTHHIDAKFYVTISSEATMTLAKYADIVQVYNKTTNFSAYNKVKGAKAELWYYDILSESRNRSAQSFIKYGWLAFRYGASGIGTWNYADANSAYTASELKGFQQVSKKYPSGSWTVKPKDYLRDYSLVYRNGDMLFSSLRWEALSLSLQEYQFLVAYENKYGKQKASVLVQQLISGTKTRQQWESIKMALIK